MLAPFDREAADRLSEEASDRLRIHGELYARLGALNAATERRRRLVALARVLGDEREVARLQNHLGNALKRQGEFTGGSEGLRLLDEAVAAYRNALAYTPAPDALGWAMKQNNSARYRTQRRQAEGAALREASRHATRSPSQRAEARRVGYDAEQPSRSASD